MSHSPSSFRIEAQETKINCLASTLFMIISSLSKVYKKKKITRQVSFFFFFPIYVAISFSHATSVDVMLFVKQSPSYLCCWWQQACRHSEDTFGTLTPSFDSQDFFFWDAVKIDAILMTPKFCVNNFFEWKKNMILEVISLLTHLLFHFLMPLCKKTTWRNPRLMIPLLRMETVR